MRLPRRQVERPFTGVHDEGKLVDMVRGPPKHVCGSHTFSRMSQTVGSFRA